MKKTPVVLVLLIGLISILAVCCGTVSPAETTLDLSTEIALEETSCSSCGTDSPAEPSPDLSVGKVLVENRCSTCHGIELTTSARHSRNVWAEIVDHMVIRGMSLSDQQRTDIIDYLAATYSNE